jgi:hypothetical protein
MSVFVSDAPDDLYEPARENAGIRLFKYGAVKRRRDPGWVAASAEGRLGGCLNTVPRTAHMLRSATVFN